MLSLSDLLLSARGRIGRQTYWTLIVALVALGIILSMVPFFGSVLSLALLWPFACVVTKRLHDTGRRAWLVPVIAALNLLTIVLSIVATLMAMSPASVVAAFALATPVMVLGGVSMLVTLGALLYVGLMSGTAAANRFGMPEERAISFATLVQDLRA
jgi:uncharacterized membrane protein YhaH (DUF805 family)